MSDEKRRITAEDLYDFEVINSLQISPDGTQILYALQSVDRDSEKKYTHLWRILIEDGQPQQLTFGDHSNITPQWSQDGKWIAFLSNRENEKQNQLYLLPTCGGEAFALTDLTGDIGDFSWSPDSKKIVFQFRKHDQEDIERREDEKKEKLGRVARRIEDRVFFKLDGYGYLPKARYHLWTVAIETKALSQLTDSKIHKEEDPIWSPDGQKIAFFSNRTDHPDLNPGKVDLFLFDVKENSIQKINTPEGPKVKASFSPDGRRIAYIGHEGLKADYKNDELWIVDLEKSNSAISLTADYDVDVGGGVINDIGSVIINPPAWSEDGNMLFFQIGRHGRTSLHRIELNTRNLENVLKFDGVVSGFSLDEQRKKVAYIQGSMTDPCQVALFDLETDEQTTLTDINHSILDQVDLGSFKEVWFTGADNNDLQGWIIYPPNFDPQKKYPSIMEIHGGPLTQYGFFFMHEFYYLAAQGYMIYFCNPRGGQGYGEDHARAIYYGKWGTVDFADLMAWADYMKDQAFIDPDRMGVTGGSYGGYMTAWIIGHTNRFKAAVSQRCVSNLISLWGSSDFNWSFQTIFDDKPPFENLDVLWDCSPIKHIGTASTPTLVIHSLQDLRCPIEQSEQVFVALNKLGVDTEFVIFPDSPHGVSRTGRTDRRIVRLNGILDWFERYLKDISD